MTLQRYQSFSEKADEQHYRSNNFKRKNLLLPRIPMISIYMIFKFKRLQFPVRLTFAIIINKAQGQFLKLLQVCGLNLENLCFSHAGMARGGGQ
jgi:hypothetical protein